MKQVHLIYEISGEYSETKTLVGIASTRPKAIRFIDNLQSNPYNKIVKEYRSIPHAIDDLSNGKWEELSYVVVDNHENILQSPCKISKFVTSHQEVIIENHGALTSFYALTMDKAIATAQQHLNQDGDVASPKREEFRGRIVHGSSAAVDKTEKSQVRTVYDDDEIEDTNFEVISPNYESLNRK